MTITVIRTMILGVPVALETRAPFFGDGADATAVKAAEITFVGIRGLTVVAGEVTWGVTAEPPEEVVIAGGRAGPADGTGAPRETAREKDVIEVVGEEEE
jgi:hypothetical protein